MNENISMLVGVLCVGIAVVGKNGSFHQWFQALDRILRGEATRPAALIQQSIDVPILGLSTVLCGLAVSYGICMGVYAGFHPDGPSYMQWLACTIKVPSLFFLTLCVTCPSLYVFNALIGSKLQIVPMLQLLVAALAVNLAVLASLGPIVAFFSFCTTSSPFMTILNVVVFALSGVLGMVFLLQTLQRLNVMRQFAEDASAGELSGQEPPIPHRPETTSPEGAPEPAAAGSFFQEPGVQGPYDIEPGQPAPASRRAEQSRRKFVVAADEPSALEGMRGHVLGRHVKTVFVCWIVIFGVVGGQMAWVLRPFFLSGAQHFIWFAPRGSNFFEGVFQALAVLLNSK
jgi:hypothetical protein